MSPGSEASVGEPRERLRGYLDLAGRLPPTLARELPIFLAQVDIYVVRVFLGTDAPYPRSVCFYNQRGRASPVPHLEEARARQWCEELDRLSKLWPLDCLPRGLWRSQNNYIRRLGGVLTFIGDGRLRLNFTADPVVQRQYAEGQWRELAPHEDA